MSTVTKQVGQCTYIVRPWYGLLTPEFEPYCKALGGRPGRIYNDEENAAVSNMLAVNQISQVYLGLYGYHDGTGLEWYWGTNETLYWNAWGPGEPDGYRSADGLSEKYAVLTYVGTYVLLTSRGSS